MRDTYHGKRYWLTGAGRLSALVVFLGCVTAVVASEVPGKPVLQKWRIPATISNGSVDVFWDMWWGVNGTQWELTEDGKTIHSAALTPNGNEAQHGQLSLVDRTPGSHTYQVLLRTATGVTKSEAVTVLFAGGGNPVDDDNDTPDTPAVKPGTPAIAWMPSQNTTGSFTVSWNMWWGNNGNRAILLENDVEIARKDLTPNSPQAQSGSFAIAGRENGSYRYVVRLASVSGSDTQYSDSAVSTVTVAKNGYTPPPAPEPDPEPGDDDDDDANSIAPAKPVIAWMATPEAGKAFTVSWNLWYGENGEEVVLYENGVALAAQTLTPHTPQAQSGSFTVPARTAGSYVYAVELVKQTASYEYLRTRSDPVTVTIAAPNDPGYVPDPNETFAPEIPVDRQRVVGYFPEWGIYSRNYQVKDIPAARLTHINYAFAVVKNGRISVFDTYAALERQDNGLTGTYAQMRYLKKQYPHLKVLISVGGWNDSAPFPAMASSAASRKVFADSVREFLDTYGFDGVDIDWEYPVIGGAAPSTPADKENYTLLLRDLRAAIGPDKLLTIAANASAAGINAIEYDKFHQYLDWINIMSYDFHGPWDSFAGHNSPLYDDKDPIDTSFNTDAAVRNILARGVPGKKIVIGVAFYGRSRIGVAASDPIWAPAGGTGPFSFEAGVLDYKDIAANYRNAPGYVYHWDEQAQVPYLYNQSTGAFISYDDPRSVRNKASYVINKGIGGVMFWELSNDNGELLGAVKEGLFK